MKKLSPFFLFLFFFTARILHTTENISPVLDKSDQKGSIIVHIQNLKKPEGLLGVALFSSEQGFPGKSERAFAKKGVKITATSQDVTFDNIPYGTYAISVFHDENSNEKLDTMIFGIPKEGVGVSNNPKMTGPPKFKRSKILSLPQNRKEMIILMKYI
ncbi:DUF2141 domain-containing protein [Chlorobium phaeobacteroides]|uniref:DUF2141 domain-containing protein n=1 Tax=Chlorobium phaeobacteroides (strain DSM 266 / SMG 266 / 2430) TaxID=290317 RepID=A1BGP5_CHLPD|nr:DUF2141 domain-containing protein [Chlorobium phaeobacteroides]ABL65572.1 conserved hypothetical protein [Chlorobium phaeobacteroides DSM 266]